MSTLTLKLKNLLNHSRNMILPNDKNRIEQAIFNYWKSLNKVIDLYRKHGIYEVCDNSLAPDPYANIALNLVNKIRENAENIKFARMFVYADLIETVENLNVISSIYEELISKYNKEDIDNIVNAVYKNEIML